MHMLQNHRSFGSVANAVVAVALAPIFMGQSRQHAGQMGPELDAGGSR